MLKVGYKLKIGSWAVDSSQDARTELLEVQTVLTMNSARNYCRIVLFAPPPPKKGLMEELAGAAVAAVGLGGAAPSGPPEFTVDVRGEKIKYGDAISIDLTSGDVSAKVITAEVESVQSTFGFTVIRGSLGSQKLVRTRINQVYQNQSLGDIAGDLVRQAGGATGQLEAGNNYPCFLADDTKSILSLLRDLTFREAKDFYWDDSNQLVIKEFKKKSADHTLYYGIDLLDLQVCNREVSADLIAINGESPSSNQGSDTWYWLSKDWSPFRGQAGDGARLWTRSDGAIRTKDSADQAAVSWLGRLKDGSRRGTLKTLGRPDVKLGDALEIKNAEKPELNGLFKVVSVQHFFSKRDGYLTVFEVTGGGGAQEAKSLLGAAAGQLAGAVGL